MNTLLRVLLLTIHLNCNANPDAKFLRKKWPNQASVSKICLHAKGVPEGYDIFITATGHVEAIVLMTNSGSKEK